MSALKPPHAYRLPPQHADRIVFLAVSGSHMFGFESPDSDYDLRGAHLALTQDVLALPTLHRVRETVELAEPSAPGSEELVTHEVAKFVSLMIKNGGNLIEQVLSPHVVITSPIHEEWRALAPRALSRKHVEHYLGFAASQVKLMRRRPDKETKIFLYIFRVLLSGIIAARDGVVDAHLPTLLERLEPRDVAMRDVVREARRLIAWKRMSPEESILADDFDADVLWPLVDALHAKLEDELSRTALPENTPHEIVAALNDGIVALRERSWS